MPRKRAPGPEKRSTSRFLARVLPGAAPGPMPDFVRPCLPTHRARPPAESGWLHEILFDGHRIQAHLTERGPFLFDQDGEDQTPRFARVAAALSRLPVGTIVLDGVVIVQNARGVSDRAALDADVARGRGDRFIYYAFDLLHLDGFTITAAPLVERKRVLASLLDEAGSAVIACSAHFEGDGRVVHEQATEMGVRGIVSKKGAAAYRSGRNTDWLAIEVATRRPSAPARAPSSPKPARPAPPADGPLLVIDGDSFAHRAYHALPKTIRRSDGKGGGAIVGFANYLLRFCEAERPRAVLAAWDTLAVPNWRQKIFPSYQGGRVFDRALLDQLDVLPEFVAACGFANAKHAGYEADDFLAAAVAREEKRGGRIIVASGDRDAFQLASQATTILHPVRAGEMARIGVDEVRERYGVEPKQVPDFIALRGDPSDKIPGAKGVGAHGAASLLQRYPSVEAALKDGLFSRQAEDLRLYRRIATMDASAPLPRLGKQRPDWAGGSALARLWGLGALADRLAKMAG